MRCRGEKKTKKEKTRVLAGLGPEKRAGQEKCLI